MTSFTNLIMDYSSMNFDVCELMATGMKHSQKISVSCPTYEKAAFLSDRRQGQWGVFIDFP